LCAANQTKEILLATSPYAVNFCSPPFGNIRLEKTIFEKEEFKDYSPQEIIDFFSSLENSFQVDILHTRDQPLLRVCVGKK
jgi:hypothetical protein